MLASASSDRFSRLPDIIVEIVIHHETRTMSDTINARIPHRIGNRSSLSTGARNKGPQRSENGEDPRAGRIFNRASWGATANYHRGRRLILGREGISRYESANVREIGAQRAFQWTRVLLDTDACSVALVNQADKCHHQPAIRLVSQHLAESC